MILINSANFQIADIDLSKDIFFVGDNAGGKTTSTRALHFLYNGDGQKLGIPHSKDSFSKHYFPHDDSYIIYVFDTFFIFTYKRQDTIKRWFSKQEFDFEKIIREGKLNEFKAIEAYIKSAPLKYKPQSIDEYTSILYGGNKHYLDFAIANIKERKIFLDVFNMIFNIDKAIVTAKDIKKAIQKSLDRKDEALSIDYDDFIRKLNSFSRAYHFFKIFDGSRTHLKNALETKDSLLRLEKSTETQHKAINYRYRFELAEFNKQEGFIREIIDEIKSHKDRIASIRNHYDTGFEKRLSDKQNKQNKKVARLEVLAEKFNPLDIEEKTLLANKHDGIKKELDLKKYSLLKLKEKQTSSQKEIANEIEQIEYKIKTTIPNETSQNIYTLSQIEKTTHANEVLEIEKEYIEQEDEIKDEIKIIDEKIGVYEDEKNSFDLEVSQKQQELNSRYENELKQVKAKEASLLDNSNELTRQINKTKDDKHQYELKFKAHKEKYMKLRKENAKFLFSERAVLNNKIANARAILNPIENSFNEFLSTEVDGWEKYIYPIIDKDLLKKSCDELKPELIDGKDVIGFKVDTSKLETIPTKDEALEIITKAKEDKRTLLKNEKEVYKKEVSKLDEEKNELDAIIGSFEKKIESLIYDRALIEASLEKISNGKLQLFTAMQEKLEDLQKEYKEKKERIKKKITSAKAEIESHKKDLRELLSGKNNEVKKSAERRDFNIEVIASNEKKKAKEEIEVLRTKIDALQKDKKSISEDEMIAKIEDEVRPMEDGLSKATQAIQFLEEYKEEKEAILGLPAEELTLNKLKRLYESRKGLIKKLEGIFSDKIKKSTDKKQELELRLKEFQKGTKKVQEESIKIGNEEIETEEYLVDLVNAYTDIIREYKNKKARFRELIDRLKKLETYSIIELNFNTEDFGDVDSINELENIMDSLNELSDFEKHKYESEKKRSHNSFDLFLRNTIPGKLQSFEDLENEFEKAKSSINRSLSNADFGVIREIKLITDSSKNRNDSIAALLQELSKKVNDTIGLYSNKSLFYHDVSRSVGNIDDIQRILEEIKKKGSGGSINLFDTIDLSMSYIENGKKVENKLNIKDESSSGGNILLKVAIAMAILSRYSRKTTKDTPFFLIIDEVSKLQSKNQNLIHSYINENGFKTLFITPDPAYPDPERAIYYTFKNIQNEGDVLEIRQMNIV